jgi:hypothetical protein
MQACSWQHVAGSAPLLQAHSSCCVQLKGGTGRNCITGTPPVLLLLLLLLLRLPKHGNQMVHATDMAQPAWLSWCLAYCCCC